MNHADLSKSQRLQTVARLLRDFPDGLTTFGLASACGSVAIHSDVAELRANGLAVECQYEGQTAEGRRVYRYVLAQPAALEASQ